MVSLILGPLYGSFSPPRQQPQLKYSHHQGTLICFHDQGTLFSFFPSKPQPWAARWNQVEIETIKTTSLDDNKNLTYSQCGSNKANFLSFCSPFFKNTKLDIDEHRIKFKPGPISNVTVKRLSSSWSSSTLPLPSCSSVRVLQLLSKHGYTFSGLLWMWNDSKVTFHIYLFSSSWKKSFYFHWVSNFNLKVGNIHIYVRNNSARLIFLLPLTRAS